MAQCRNSLAPGLALGFSSHQTLLHLADAATLHVVDHGNQRIQVFPPD
ncbi:hypothetical protein [Desulfuromonas sp. DDH964]|nr:hypothetical protein [Desulfuromonas sp. DDH964]AMV73096.1 hypothetical protein DBW_2786 [Desulfuromonas sp. DDH964]